LTTYLKPALLLGALVLLWLAMLLLGAGAVDHRVLLDLYAGHRPVLADAARLITMLGDGRVVTLFAVVGAIASRRCAFTSRRHGS